MSRTFVQVAYGTAVPRQIAALYGNRKSILAFKRISDLSESKSRILLTSTSKACVLFTTKQLLGL